MLDDFLGARHNPSAASARPMAVKINTGDLVGLNKRAGVTDWE
jgi:hypothetical protein